VVDQFSLRLAGGRDAPAEARRYLRRFHGDLDPELFQVLSLLVSELVTNCVRHARAGSGSLILLDAELRPSAVRVEVEDGGPGFRPRAARPDPARGRGFGLYLVDELTDRWGVRATGNGARVWFEIDR
jgi:anti-sigma regulatory factor (Ser/Thr protein kinase)